MSEIQKYKPSNATEGEIFIGAFCEQCTKMPKSIYAKNQCKILGKAMAFDVNDKEYPIQWQYADDGLVIYKGIQGAKCTAYKSRQEHNANRKKPKRDKFTLDIFESNG